MCVRARACVCVCVWVCVCVRACVCVCDRDGGREDSESEKERKRDTGLSTEKEREEGEGGGRGVMEAERESAHFYFFFLSQSRNPSTPDCSGLHNRDVNLKDSKAALQSLISSTSDQPTHQLLKDLQLLSQECTLVLQWIPAHFGIPGNERADRLAKSGSKRPQPLYTSTYKEAKTLLRIRHRSQMEKGRWRLLPLYKPILPSGKTWADHYIQVANRTL